MFLIVPEEDWFGQLKYHEYSKKLKKIYAVSVSASTVYMY